MRERVYQSIIGVLFAMILLYANASHRNYMKLLEVNEMVLDTISEQKDYDETANEEWVRLYEDLQLAYGESLVENHQLERKLEEVSEVELPTYEFTEAEIYMLAQCVEAEAGHYKRHRNSQKYVTQVILNRVHSGKFPNTIAEVIYQKINGVPQFSVAYNGAMDRDVTPETLANVYSVIAHGTDLPEYVCYFYSDYVTENWVNTLPVHKTVEGTVFAYANKEDY